MSDHNSPEHVSALLKEYNVWSYVQNLDDIIPHGYTLIVCTQYMLHDIRFCEGKDVFQGKYKKYRDGKSLVFNIVPKTLDGQSSIRAVFVDQKSKTVTIIRPGEVTEHNSLLRDIIMGFSQIDREKIFNSKILVIHSVEDNSTLIMDLTKRVI